ncbi:MAG: DUF2029 domain-containing protein [Planctomycetes bacterium]|nr:DUF2029 domain-containing protein [Planctomycetota bacterium]
MSNPLEAKPISNSTLRVVLFILAVMAFFGPPAYRNRQPLPQGQFIALAQAFIRGEMTFQIEPGSNLRTLELIPSDTSDRFYCAYPPLPAVLLVPFVLLVGTSFTVAFSTRALSVAAVLLIDACLARLPRRLGLQEPTPTVRFCFTTCFSFGTMVWPNADMAGDWHLAHIVALVAMLLALLEYAGKERGFWLGVFVALAMLSRPTTALTCSFFAFEAIRRKNWRGFATLLIGPVAAVAILALYNQARFGSPFDFAYDRMILTGDGERLMREHGQFNLAYVSRNLFWFFAAPPAVMRSGEFPWLGYDPRGMSLLISSPIFLYALVAVARKFRSDRVVQHAAISILLVLIPLLLYFNTGYWQLGHRFGMDYLPLLIVLSIIGTKFRFTGITFALMALSILIHSVGVIALPVARLPIE